MCTTSPTLSPSLLPTRPLADLYYPELLGCARVLNAAWALHQGWKLVKPLLSKQIQDMVRARRDTPPPKTKLKN